MQNKLIRIEKYLSRYYPKVKKNLDKNEKIYQDKMRKYRQKNVITTKTIVPQKALDELHKNIRNRIRRLSKEKWKNVKMDKVKQKEIWESKYRIW